MSEIESRQKRSASHNTGMVVHSALRRSAAALGLALLLALSALGCGADIGDRPIDDGSTVRVNRSFPISVPINFTSHPCFDAGEEAECSNAFSIGVLLPPSVEFVGEAEITRDTGELLFSEEDIGAPDLYGCPDGSQGLVFHIDSAIKSAADDEDSSIFVDLIAAIADEVSEGMRIHIAARVPGTNFKVWSIQGGLQGNPLAVLCRLPEAREPIAQFNVAR